MTRAIFIVMVLVLAGAAGLSLTATATTSASVSTPLANTAGPQAATPVPVAQLAPPAPNAVPDSQAIDADWRAWMDRAGVTRSTIAVVQSGEILHTADAGRSATQNYPMASLSKAVTAICLNELLAHTPYDWSTTLGDLGALLNRVGPAPAPQISALTLTELATQTSGLPKDIPNTDRTRGTSFSQSTFARSILINPSFIGARGEYHYSNVNYALLGHVIEALSETSYSDHCAATIMAPAGANEAAVAGRMWATAGFGGWQMSVQDYARFVMHWFAPDQPWVQNPKIGPWAANTNYGLGVIQYDTADGHVITHMGRWSNNDPNRQHGTLFMTTHTGAVAVISWQGHLDDAQYQDLSDTIAVHLR